ncbi:Signal recognition particle receptor protein FtsY [Labilithrix luteola]|uniref:Signal recognition particle receptor protein FtsY n=1 Tax=Labilithrix luteola TaxID=1391654 RepID=A0A0K1Q559_9BACT|nr:TIGR02266 family protein [Labilithrix luteola]AKV00971.1 Signal recognition particle receptor protein FtsY [Labilithrix luteola]
MADAARKIDEQEHSDVRRSARASVYVNVDITSEHNFWTDMTMNIAEGGVFVATHQEVPLGTVLVVNMMLPRERAAIVAFAEVRWTRAYSGQADVPPGLGLAFVHVEDDGLTRIRRFLATVREPLFFED